MTPLPSLETIAIGDELLTGKISDTNSTFVANELFALGLRLDRQTVIADDPSTMQRTFKEAALRAHTVICFGGLGPTSDDKTAQCLADLLECKLIEHEPSKNRLIEFVQKRNRTLTPQILKQIVYPEKSIPLFNSSGLAVGIDAMIGKTRFFFLPGVPTEMKAMFKDHLLPILKTLDAGEEKIHSQVWRCLELPESELQRHMDPIEKALPPAAWLGYRTQFPENHLTLYYRSKEVPKDFESWKAKISNILGPYIYAQGAKTIEQVVFDLLKEKKKTVAFVESCTGGIACHRLSQIPGASLVLAGGLVTYQREVKNKVLGLKLMTENETVSAETTRRLAENTKAQFGADLVASITGYIGPTGGTNEDPIGTLYLGVLGKGYLEKRIFQPWKDRTQSQWGAASHLLNLLRAVLLEEK